MDIHDFFSFSSQHSSSTIQVHVIGIDHTPDPTGKKFFDSTRLLAGDYGPIHFPVLVKQENGRKWDDILNTGYVSLHLISDRMKMILEENKLTGWKNFPIRFLDKKGNEILDYHGFSITGRCASIDYSKSEIIQKRATEHSPLRDYYKGARIDLDKWDGSDFFLPKKNKRIIITAKAADVLKKHKISNFVLENLANIEVRESFVKETEEDKKRVWHW